MKRKPGYLLQRIANTDYLLPYGQHIADHRRGISLNSSGVFVWNLLENEMPREELLSECLKHFSDDPEQNEALTSDLNQFLDQLIAFQFIEDDNPMRRCSYRECTYLGIGGLTLEVYGPKELIEASYLKDFEIDSADRADMNISVIWGAPDSTDNGTVLVRNPELWVLDTDTDYLLLFPTLSQINEVSVSKDGSEAYFYCKPPFSDELGEQFFHAMRHVFLYLAQKHGMYAIHSASIRYADKAWLFSAVSGTGKSTHASLWKKLYGTETINGDLNLLAIEGGLPVIRGIPWCGTSEVFDKKTVPLGGIILLKRNDNDSIAELPPDKKALLIMQRFISPMWTAELLHKSAQFAEDLSKQILVCQLRCTKNDAAAEVMKSRIDAHNAQAQQM